MTPDIETIVIGAGAVGLAIARALAMGGHEVCVLERHGLIGSETSSRNSEVIHAGIYYPPGSLRARFCVRGKEMLYTFLAEHGLPHQRIGKLLVATTPAQLGALATYRDVARRNGAGELDPLTAEQVRALEPAVRCEAGLFSPTTGILDSHAYMLALEGEAEALRSQIVLHTPVEAITSDRDGLFRLATGGSSPASVTCRNLVIAAGLSSTDLARTLAFPGGYGPPATHFARGQYFSLRGRSPFRHLVYPMPDGAWLGIHVTLDLAGRAKFGPDIEWIDAIDYSFNPANEGKFYEAVRRYWPELPDGALQPDSTGIRPKLYRQGEPVADFAIHGPEAHGLAGLVALYGIESPGLTSSLAIAEHVALMLA